MEEKILQAIEGLKIDFNHKLDSLKQDVGTLREDVSVLKQDVDFLRQDVGTLKQDVAFLRQDVGTLKQDVNLLNQDVGSLTSQVSENTQILKALEHLAQVNKAEHEKISFDIAEMTSEVKSMRKALFTVELVTANNWSDIAKIKSIK